jgi:RNA polymerase sigma factor (sigma-70 family)
MSDQEIISQLRTGQQHKALVKLYAHLPKVERMVRNHSGTRADAKDLFQDALIILLGKAKDEGFTLSCSISTYLYAICRNRWQEELRRRGRFTQELEALPEEPNDLGAVLADEQNISLAERALQALGRQVPGTPETLLPAEGTAAHHRQVHRAGGRGRGQNAEVQVPGGSPQALPLVARTRIRRTTSTPLSHARRTEPDRTRRPLPTRRNERHR